MHQHLAERGAVGGFIYSIGLILICVPDYYILKRPFLVFGMSFLCFIVAVSRFYSYKNFEKNYDLNPANWRRRFVGAIFASAFLWGAFGSINIIWDGTSNTALVFTAGSAGLAAGGSTAFSADEKIYKNFLYLLLGLPVIVSIYSFNTFGFAMAAAGIMFNFYFAMLAKKQGKNYWTGLFDNEQLRIKSIDLDKAKRQAESAMEAKAMFLANMSHELRTPMNAVIGSSELLDNTKLSHEQKEYVDIIQNSGDALLHIINDILDLSKIDAGKLKLENKPFDLGTFLTEILDMFRVQSYGRELQLGLYIDPSVPLSIFGDSKRLQQVLINLIGNALKFTDRGHVILKVDAQEKSILKSDSGIFMIRFIIEDTGIGISAENQKSLFNAFSQADTSTTRKYGGTGLGLAISKKIIEMAGGHIWVKSTESVGSEFGFTIKCKQAKHNKMNWSEKIIQDKSIVLIHDYKPIAEHLKLYLENWGASVDLIDQFKGPISGTADIVIVDEAVSIGNMDSLKFGNAKKILLTENHEIDKNWDYHISKPLKPIEFFKTIRNVYQKEKKKEINAPFKSEISKSKTLRILLAEDNIVNQKVALRMLAQLGYDASLASTGLEVISKLKDQDFDVIFMDIQMPEMDGLQATRHVLKEWSTNRPAIIALTANATPEDKQLCFEAGMDDYLSKPVRLDELRQKLAKFGNNLVKK
ncbi:MAG: response regulator [Calditrichaeota bacterium]|nr:response regulator [Calditrichota bacterium]